MNRDLFINDRRRCRNLAREYEIASTGMTDMLVGSSLRANKRGFIRAHNTEKISIEIELTIKFQE
jgi:hypothetical protein